MGFGVSTFFESSDALLSRSVSSSLGSFDTSTSFVLSGDHSKFDTPPGISVSRSASPPERFKSQTCLFVAGSFDEPESSPPLAVMDARYFPSGLKRGLPSLPSE